jgi:SNF2 family DNA or RNA helicase
MDRFQKYVEFAGLDYKQYQCDGVDWCLNNERTRGGGILADEMGLGKTITMIGLMVANPLRPTLIVLPPALVDQWDGQLTKTTGHKALIYRGAAKKSVDVDQLKSVRIVIASYGAIAITKKQPTTLLHAVDWGRIVFDEAHHLRNKNTSVYFGAKSLTTDVRWLITGTPIQNKRRDLSNLCSLLGVKDEDFVAQNYILRRTKKDVGIELPAISTNERNVEWGEDLDLSEQVHSAIDMCETDKGVPRQFRGEINKLTMMMRARQMCTYPQLFDPTMTGTSKLDSVAAAILANKDNGNGKLVFCSFRAEIDELKRRLLAGGMGRVASFDGRTSITKRRSILAGDNEVILLQIQTGCEGLNLQERYSEVYFVSPHWNPAVEDQAVARCHRIGQTKNVVVNRFVMCGFESESSCSLDNYVTAVQDSKRLILI